MQIYYYEYANYWVDNRDGGTPMRERPQRDVSDGCSWWCSTCKTRKSVREGSFFAKSRISLQKWLLLMYLWAREYPVTDAKEEAEVDKHTVIDIYQWVLRSLFNEANTEQSSPWWAWNYCTD